MKTIVALAAIFALLGACGKNGALRPPTPVSPIADAPERPV